MDDEFSFLDGKTIVGHTFVEDDARLHIAFSDGTEALIEGGSGSGIEFLQAYVGTPICECGHRMWSHREEIDGAVAFTSCHGLHCNCIKWRKKQYTREV